MTGSSQSNRDDCHSLAIAGESYNSTGTSDPSRADHELYLEWSAGYRSVADLAHERSDSIQTISQSIRNTARYLTHRSRKIVAIRVRQTEALDRAIELAMKIWKEKTDVRFLSEARKAMADIRKMWGRERSDTESRRNGPSRVAGASRVESLRVQAARLLQVADSLDRDATGSQPQGTGIEDSSQAPPV